METRELIDGFVRPLSPSLGYCATTIRFRKWAGDQVRRRHRREINGLLEVCHRQTKRQGVS